MNRIGHSSPSFCHDPIEATVHAIEEEGFDVWEIVGEGGHDPWEQRKEFRRVLPSYKVKVQLHLPISDCNLGSLIPSAWEDAVSRVERALRGAATFDVRQATIHPGNHSPLSRGHYDYLHEATRRALRRVEKVAKEVGIDLCLENMPTGWAFETDSAERLLDLVEGSNTRLCLDVAHAHVARRVDELVALSKRIRNVHLSDNKGDVDAHWTLGDGKVPWEDAVEDLLSAGYKGAFIIESHNHASGVESRHHLMRWLERLE